MLEWISNNFIKNHQLQSFLFNCVVASSSYSFIVQNQHNTAVMINNTLKI